MVIIENMNPTLSTQLGQRLTTLNQTIVTAESCTGGLVAHLITNIAGSSAYFLGGIVAYANEVKMGQLGVREATLIEHGAVSEATALEMCAGAAQRLEADYAISISGIAGPGGGTPEKPVGFVCFGLHTPHGNFSTFQNFTGDRVSIKAQAADFALQYTLTHIGGQ